MPILRNLANPFFALFKDRVTLCVCLKCTLYLYIRINKKLFNVFETQVEWNNISSISSIVSVVQLFLITLRMQINSLSVYYPTFAFLPSTFTHSTAMPFT
jgi:hypothetical protein